VPTFVILLCTFVIHSGTNIMHRDKREQVVRPTTSFSVGVPIKQNYLNYISLAYCVCVCLRFRMGVSVYVRVRMCMCVDVSTRVNVCVRMRQFARACLGGLVRAYVCACVCTRARSSVCSCLGVGVLQRVCLDKTPLRYLVKTHIP
jgi:hypothetical protein